MFASGLFAGGRCGNNSQSHMVFSAATTSPGTFFFPQEFSMKSQFLAASLLGVVAVCGCNSETGEPAADGAAVTAPEGMTKVVLSVPAMH